jgi:hypothetical protein
MSAEVTAGGSLGKKIILIPGVAVAAGQVGLSVDKTQVIFPLADAVTKAKITLGTIPVTNVEALLGADSQLQ